MSDKSSEEISVFMNVRLRAQPDNPFALDPTTTTPQQAPINTTNTHTDKATDSTQGGPGQAQGPGAPGPVLPLPGQGPSVAGQQPNVGVGVGLGMGSVGQQDPVTSVMGFAGQGTSGVLDGQSEQFEVGVWGDTHVGIHSRASLYALQHAWCMHGSGNVEDAKSVHAHVRYSTHTS